jgi:hypothetical protein
MLIATLLAQTVVTPPPAPPPAPAPRPVTRGPDTYLTAPPRERFRLAVTLRSASALLWDGDLWVANSGQSSWSESRTEPPEQTCTPAAYYGSSRSAETSVTVNALQRGAETYLNVTVRWSRASDAPCGGLRTVELRETVPMPGERPAVIRGDGGLVLELRRR